MFRSALCASALLPWLIAALPDATPVAGAAAFALPGLGCLALLPLTIGFGQEQLESIAAAAAGGISAFYQVGYGIAAFGVGPLPADGVHLWAIYGLAAAVAAAMGLLPFAVVGRPHEARSEPSPTARSFPR